MPVAAMLRLRYTSCSADGQTKRSFLAVIFFRLVRALTHSEQIGNTGFGQLVGDLEEA